MARPEMPTRSPSVAGRFIGAGSIAHGALALNERAGRVGTSMLTAGLGAPGRQCRRSLHGEVRSANAGDGAL